MASVIVVVKARDDFLACGWQLLGISDTTVNRKLRKRAL